MRIRVRIVTRLFTATCLGAGLYAWAVEPFWLEVTRHTLALPAVGALRIVHLSDLHTSGMGRLERRMLDRLAAARPDIVVITGDVLATGRRRSLSPAEQRAVQEVLSKLQAPLGVFAVPGNWEYWRGLEDPTPLFAGAGVRLLRNGAAEVRRGLWIVGVDDACAGRADVDAAFAGMPADATVIALMHSPSPFPRVAPRAPLVLAGHSHGGQVRLPFLGALWLPPETGRFVQGWYTSGSSRLYVSRGVGTSIFRLRFLCRPEIAVIDVRPH
jgi:predicted MPP superfamily phosphohydrolase